MEIRPFAVGGTGVQSYSETQPAEYPTRLEAGTLNSHGLAGLGAALAYLGAVGWDAVRAHETALARRFYEAVKDIPNVRLYGNYAMQDRAPIVALNIGDLDSAEVSDQLAERFAIATRPGAHCAPRLHRALGTEEQGAVRFSWGISTQRRRPLPRQRRSGPWRRRRCDHAGKTGAVRGDIRYHRRRHGHGGGLPGGGPAGPADPVPRAITAGCGVCWATPPDARDAIEDLVVREKLDVDGLYAVLL